MTTKNRRKLRGTGVGSITEKRNGTEFELAAIKEQVCRTIISLSSQLPFSLGSSGTPMNSQLVSWKGIRFLSFVSRQGLDSLWF